MVLRTSAAVEQFVAALVRRDSRNPRLEPGERVVYDFGALAQPGDLVLVVRAGVPLFERVQDIPRRPAADWVIAVVRVVAGA